MIRPDDQLERDLASWLKDTAGPLPGAVLAEVVADLPRTPQASRRGPFARQWSVLLAAAAVLVVVIVGRELWRAPAPALHSGAPTGSPTPSTPPVGLVWNVAADFGHGQAHGNPMPDKYGHASVWSYRFKPVGAADIATHALMTEFDPAIDKWSAKGFDNLHVYSDNDSLSMHPYLSGGDGRSALADWSSPISGNLAIHGRFAHIQGCDVPDDGVLVAVDQDGQSIWSERLQPGDSASFDLTAEVQPGDVVSFRVDPVANSNCDTTALRVTITVP